MAEPPSTIGPSVSVSETTIPRKKIDFSISHYTGETTSDLSQRDMQIRDISTTRIENRPTVIPRSTTTVVLPGTLHNKGEPLDLMKEDKSMMLRLWK